MVIIASPRQKEGEVTKMDYNHSMLQEYIDQEVIDIVERSSLSQENKTLVMQIVQNMITRGLIWTVIDATIATTECIVLCHNVKPTPLEVSEN